MGPRGDLTELHATWLTWLNSTQLDRERVTLEFEFLNLAAQSGPLVQGNSNMELECGPTGHFHASATLKCVQR